LLVKESIRFTKLKNKHKKDKVLIERIVSTIKLLEADKTDVALHFKKITCKTDKNRYSVRVLNTKYRILMTVFDEYVELFCVCNHDTYDRYNDNC
jgi:Txe/YoeB family toxin of Txe-Axe toxin-antitoxin module